MADGVPSIRKNDAGGTAVLGKTFLFFSAQYLPTMGGVERYTCQLAKRLIHDGHRVIVATSALKALPAWEIDADGIEIYRFPSFPLMHGRFPVLHPGRAFRRLARQLWSQEIDDCVINTYFYPLSIYAACQARKRSLPRLVINHGSAWLMTGSKPLVLAGALYERCAAWFCHRSCPDFYGVSEASVQWLTTFSITARGVITNAIDPEETRRSADAGKNWRECLHLPASAPVIAFVGRMIPEKGVDSLLAAMPRIRQAFPDCHLLMAGAGPLYDRYRLHTPDGVVLLGGQPYPDVLSLLRQADLFCLPTRSEGFACTVLEAAAVGCPILTTATGGSPQLLPDESYGIILKDMTPDTVADACIRALSDPGWRQTAGEKARRRLQECYTWDVALAQLYHAFGLDGQ
ncbi:MAG: glycosyltransferase family 4 protein [Firmicutes bacterium]|nr:glycosyltransferase family 4 protein [Bacillota bacterium]